MKAPVLLLLVAGLFGCSSIPKEGPVRVEASGLTLEDAKNTGFKKALVQNKKSVVVSEREVHNNSLLKDNQIVYSSGYIKDFDVREVKQANGLYNVTMDVWLSDSDIADRAIKMPSNSNGIVDNISLQHYTYTQEKEYGDKLLGAVLDDFPKKAFDLNQGKSNLSYNTFREGELTIPFTLTWNQNYISSMKEILKSMETDKTINRVWFSSDINSSKIDSIKINDSVRLFKIKNVLESKSVRIQVEVLDHHNATLIKSCYVPKFVRNQGNKFYASYKDDIIFNTYQKEYTNLIIPVKGNSTFSNRLKEFSKIQLSVVNADECKKKSLAYNKR